MRKIYLLLTFFVLFTFIGNGQTLGVDTFTLGNDNSDNYGVTWGTTNQGTGFSDWAFDQGIPYGGFAGRFIGSFSTELDVNGNSFGMFANSGDDAFSGAAISMPKTMEEGDSFTVSVGVNFRDGNKGFDLRDGSNNSFVNFNVGSDEYNITGTPGLFSNVYDANTVITFTFTQNANSVSWTADRTGGLSGSESGTINSINSGTITNIRFYNVSAGTNNDGGSGQRNLYLNSLNFESTYTIAENSTINVNSSTTVPYLTVEAGSTIIVEKTGDIEVLGNLSNSGSITLNSDSDEFSSLIVGGTATGDITYNRYTAEVGPTGTNDLIASPVSGQDFGPFATANAEALAESGTLRAFAPFDPVNNIYTNYDTSTNANTPITPGIGYRAATNSGQTLAFTGTPNNGAVAVTLQDNTSFWNLIGNPYPSYIDIGDFLAENVATTNINASFYGVYGYDGDVTNGWTVWDLNVDQDLLIAPGQGFFVAAPSGGGSGIDFTTAMRRIGTSDDFIAGRNTTSDANFAHAILNLNTASASYGTNVYFRDINTLGLDPGYDTGAFDQTANGIFTQLVENNNGVNLMNQSLPYNDLNEVTVPLNVNMSQVQTLDFSLDNNTILPPAINVYLEDTVTSTFTLLNNNTYQVTPEIALNGTGRFFLRFTSGTLGIDQETINSLNIYHDAAAKNIVIGGQLNENTAAYVYDLQGRLVQSHVLQAALVQQHMDVSSLHTGIYIVKIGQQITHKVMIR